MLLKAGPMVELSKSIGVTTYWLHVNYNEVEDNLNYDKDELAGETKGEGKWKKGVKPIRWLITKINNCGCVRHPKTCTSTTKVRMILCKPVTWKLATAGWGRKVWHSNHFAFLLAFLEYQADFDLRQKTNIVSE